jgi:hypothetical protein
MNTTGFCVAYRNGDEWRLCKTFTCDDERCITVLPTHQAALNFLAAQGFDAPTETAIVPVTISGELPRTFPTGKTKLKENERAD